MVKIYHNPRCSKSRQTLALLQENGLEVEIIEYLKTPVSFDELQQLLTMLGMSPFDLMRRGEDEYKTLVKDKDLSDVQALQVMLENPRLIERPIVISNGKAAIGRPPESVLAIL